jgi:hypothetical protein
MSRPATKQLTLRFVLRTLARLQMMTRIPPQTLAKEVGPHCPQLRGLGDYMSDVASYMEREHDEWRCEKCGSSNRPDHNGAKYCSARCRQRAYRKRLISQRGKKKRNEPAICDASFSDDGKSNVTPPASVPL